MLLQYLEDKQFDLLVMTICESLARYEPLIFENDLEDIKVICRRDIALLGYEVSILEAIGLQDKVCNIIDSRLPSQISV